ncbi:hypothetical protein M9434_003196 [Picochlorum sp. BPE23]|nr:hypothetical protein M9434_003196 [Picochlorum sp. BPE23]
MRVSLRQTRVNYSGSVEGLVCCCTHGGEGPMTAVDTLVECLVEDRERGYRAIDAWLEDNDVTLRVLRYIEDCVVACEDEGRRYALDIVGERLAASLLGLSTCLDEGEVQRGEEEMSERASLEGQSEEGVDEGSSVAKGGVASELQLSTQGMQLLQQQAVALEATIGIRKAESIVQILGRKRVTDNDMKTVVIPEKGDAWRILEVLVQVQDRVERRDMLHEAFVPIDETEDEEYGEEEALSTTPFALLQIVQTCLASQNELDNMCRGISAPYSHDEVVHVLEELREDIIESIDGNVSC